MDLKAKRDECERQREQHLANANFAAGMMRAYDEMIAAAAAEPASAVVEGVTDGQ